MLQPLHRQRQMRTALAGHQCMNLIDDYRLDGAQRFTCIGSQQEVKRFGCGDEDVRRMTQETCTLCWWGVAGSNGNLWLMKFNSHALRRLCNTNQGRPQIALHVDGQRFDGRNVQDTATLLLFRNRREHEPVDAPEKGCQSLACSGGGKD